MSYTISKGASLSSSCFAWVFVFHFLTYSSGVGYVD
jgi:hypothetical protein